MVLFSLVPRIKPLGIGAKRRNASTYGFISSKRLVNSLNNASARSRISSGISCGSVVNHATTIRRATSGFHPSRQLDTMPHRSTLDLIH